MSSDHMITVAVCVGIVSVQVLIVVWPVDGVPSCTNCSLAVYLCLALIA